MNNIRIPLLCLLLASVPAAAQSENFADSGNAFLRVCESAPQKSAVIQMTCRAYVIGVGDGAEMVSEERFHAQAYCPSPGVENEQKYRTVVKYIKEHPERTDLQTRVLIMAALSTAFPCQRAK